MASGAGDTPDEGFSGRGGRQGRGKYKNTWHRKQGSREEGEEEGEAEEVLTRENCYRDHEMEEICGKWHMDLPDYKSALLKASAATEAGTLNYVDHLQLNSRFPKVLRPVVNGDGEGPSHGQSQVSVSPVAGGSRSSASTPDLYNLPSTSASSQVIKEPVLVAEEENQNVICTQDDTDDEPDEEFVQLSDLLYLPLRKTVPSACSELTVQPSTSESVPSQEVNLQPSRSISPSVPTPTQEVNVQSFLPSTSQAAITIANEQSFLPSRAPTQDVFIEPSPAQPSTSASSAPIKRSVLDTLTASIEQAIANGNRNFVRGGVHPLQRNRHILNLNRTSGSNDLLTSEDVNSNSY